MLCHQDCPDSDILPTFSDDLSALHELETEVRQAKNAQGIVIRHRFGKLDECFRSDDAQSFTFPSSQPISFRGNESDNLVQNIPKLDVMTGVTDPTLPPTLLSGNSILKRKRSDNRPRSPLKEVLANSSPPQVDGIFDRLSDDDEYERPVERATITRTPSKRVKVSDISPAKPRQACSDSQPKSTGLGCSLLRAPEVTPNASLSDTPDIPTSRHLSAGGLRVLQTAGGKRHTIRKRPKVTSISYEQLAAARSVTAPGRAQRSYYGIDIHTLIETAEAQAQIQVTCEKTSRTELHPDLPIASTEVRRTQLWTEKYRARKFTDLIGDDRTHRQVMHWLKRWDQIVFPGSRSNVKSNKKGDQDSEFKAHRKVMLLTGPPGLGKTTLAHVCARQAGYEVQEINASDERSKNVVQGRIRDMVGTENVKQGSSKTINGSTSIKRAARPVCVVVDEVDGAVSGAGGTGEGGFIKALIDLLNLDHRNCNRPSQQVNTSRAKRKGDSFRMLRPLILICNDIYHPALRLLRQSPYAEIIHVGKPVLNNVAARLGSVFEREVIPADSDAIRKLCEVCWGVTSRKESNGSQGTGEGDVRSIMVMAEWVAGRLRASDTSSESASQTRLTKRWFEDVFLAELNKSGGAARGLGRGGSKEIVDRVFLEGAGLNKTNSTANESAQVKINGVKGVSEAAKSKAIHNLRELVNSAGETDKIMTECFQAYPTHPWHDDTMLSKPAQAYDWLFFHDALSSAVYQTSEWELAPYLCQPILAFHSLFAVSKTAQLRYGSHLAVTDESDEAHPFCTPQASYLAHEATKSQTAILDALRTGLSLPLSRLFPTVTSLALDLAPYVARMLSPPVNPVLITGSGESKHVSTATIRKASEKLLVERAVNAMLATGLGFSRLRLDHTPSADPMSASSSGPAAATRQHAGWIYRMEPALDIYGAYGTAGLKPSSLSSSFSSLSKSLSGSTVDTPSANNDVNSAGQRYAVRQILDQERTRALAKLDGEARQRRFAHGQLPGSEEDTADLQPVTDSNARLISAAHPDLIREGSGSTERSRVVKRDFFGREIVTVTTAEDGSRGKGRNGNDDTHSGSGAGINGNMNRASSKRKEKRRVWVSYNEGFSNAVRKPVSLVELMKEFD